MGEWRERSACSNAAVEIGWVMTGVMVGHACGRRGIARGLQSLPMAMREGRACSLASGGGSVDWLLSLGFDRRMSAGTACGPDRNHVKLLFRCVKRMGVLSLVEAPRSLSGSAAITVNLGRPPELAGVLP